MSTLLTLKLTIKNPEDICERLAALTKHTMSLESGYHNIRDIQLIQIHTLSIYEQVLYKCLYIVVTHLRRVKHFCSEQKLRQRGPG